MSDESKNLEMRAQLEAQGYQSKGIFDRTVGVRLGERRDDDGFPIGVAIIYRPDFPLSDHELARQFTTAREESVVVPAINVQDHTISRQYALVYAREKKD